MPGGSVNKNWTYIQEMDIHSKAKYEINFIFWAPRKETGNENIHFYVFINIFLCISV
jgi:hypothetical protein